MIAIEQEDRDSGLREPAYLFHEKETGLIVAPIAVIEVASNDDEGNLGNSVRGPVPNERSVALVYMRTRRPQDPRPVGHQVCQLMSPLGTARNTPRAQTNSDY
jgi:hypothetical protein